MQVHVQGAGAVKLTKRDFVAAGGEGSVYVKGQTAYKVYADPAKMIPVDKLAELARITAPNVVKPDKVLRDDAGTAVGYTMPFVPASVALCQLFTKAFRQRNGIDDRAILSLVQRLQETVAEVHRAQVLIVDLNELNVLVSADFKEPHLIDVDSYQTPSFPATAIMDSVRDWHAKAFSEETDWFSWAVITFQLFMGVHPYKGKHPSVKGLKERMRAGLSVFNADVRVPRMCPPLDSIPQAYRDWYRAVLEEGRRMAPPDASGAAVVVTVQAAQSRGVNVMITPVAEFDGDIVDYWARGDTEAVLTPKQAVVNGRPIPLPADATRSGARLAVTPRRGHVLVAWLNGGVLELFDLTERRRHTTDLHAEKLMVCDGRIYLQNRDKVSEAELLELPAGIRAAQRVVANVMPHATHLFDGVAIQDMLGAWYENVFPGPGQSVQAHLKDLAGHKIIDAKKDGSVLMVITAKDGTYHRFVFQHDSNSIAVRAVHDVPISGVNFVTLGSGICACIDEEERLELFHVRQPGAVKVVDDPAISADMRLWKRGSDVLFSRGPELFKISTRKGG